MSSAITNQPGSIAAAARGYSVQEHVGEAGGRPVARAPHQLALLYLPVAAAAEARPTRAVDELGEVGAWGCVFAATPTRSANGSRKDISFAVCGECESGE